jgi:hypothetical protein
MTLLILLLCVDFALLFLAGALDEYDNYLWPFILFIAVGGATLFLTGTGFFTALDAVKANPLNVLYGLFAYAVIGAVWSIFKWWRYLHKDDIQARIKMDFDAWKSRSENEGKPVSAFVTSPSNTVRASNSKPRIIGWIAYWPASLVWALTHDLLKWIADSVYDLLKRIYLAIADSVTRSTIGK